jgi:hypothetical protein
MNPSIWTEEVEEPISSLVAKLDYPVQQSG